MRKVDPKLLIDPAHAVMANGLFTEEMLIEAKDELCRTPGHEHWDHVEQVERELDQGLAAGHIIEVADPDGGPTSYCISMLGMMVKAVDAMNPN